MPKTTPRICLVDDDATFRESLAWEAKEAGYDLLGFDNAQAFFSGFEPQGVFCLVIACSLRGMNGMELLETLQERKTPIPIIMLTRQKNIPFAVQALQGGALDVLKKPVPPGMVTDRLHQAFGVWSSWQKIEAERQEAAERLARLTPREADVFHLIADGLKNMAIARQLGISGKTLDIHRARVMGKMKARTTADIARWRLLLEAGPGGLVHIKPGDYLG